MTHCPSRYTLVKLRAGDVPEGEMRQLYAHVADCDSCRSRYERIDERASVYEAHLDEHYAEIESKFEEAPGDPLAEVIALHPPQPNLFQRHRRLAVPTMAAAITAAAAALLFGIVSTLGQYSGVASSDDPSDLRFRGQLSFDVVAKRHENQFVVQDGALMHRGDALRFIVHVTAAGYLSIFSADADGKISNFYPNVESHSDPTPLRLDDGGRHQLPDSIVLDDSLGDEYLFIVYSKDSFDRAEVEQQLSGVDNLEDTLNAIRKNTDGALNIQYLKIHKVISR